MSRHDELLYLLSVMIYLISPFIGVITLSIAIIVLREKNKYIYYLLFTLISFYLGLINTSKVPASDLLDYINRFLDIKYFSFSEYILLYGKEPIFYAYNYLFYNLISENPNLYILSTTFISYFILLVSIYRYGKAVLLPKYIIVFLTLFIAFFPNLFSLSAHLNRQFIAGSLILYVLIENIFYGKKNYVLVITAVFIHSTVLFFVPFLYLNSLKSKLKLSNSYVLILIISIFLLVGTLSSAIVSTFGNNMFTYVFQRVIQDSYYELKPLNTLSILTLGVLIFLCFRWRKNAKYSINSRGIYHFTVIFIIYSIFVIINYYNYEISVRYFFYSYLFMPFIISKVNIKPKILMYCFYPILILLTFLYFFYKIEYGAWEYDSVVNLIFSNVLNYDI